MATTAVFAAVGNRYGLDTLFGAEAAFGLVEQLSLIVFFAIFAAIAVTLLTYELGQKRTLALSNRVNIAAGGIVVVLSFALAVLAILHARADRAAAGFNASRGSSLRPYAFAAGRKTQSIPVQIIQTVSKRKPTTAARLKTPGSKGITVASPSTRPKSRMTPPISPTAATAPQSADACDVRAPLR